MDLAKQKISARNYFTTHILSFQAQNYTQKCLGFELGASDVVTVDDNHRAFLQIVAYHQFLKGGIGGGNLSKVELKLRCAQCHAQRTIDPIVQQKVILDFEGGTNFVLVVPTLRVLRYSARKTQVQHAHWR